MSRGQTETPPSKEETISATDDMTLAVADVEFVRELYPRLREDDAAIERYRAAIDKLPPITVARGRVLVDGFHRWQAYRREGLAEIPAVDLGNLADVEIRRESITRNAAHGHQLSASDKRRLAGILWRDLTESNGSRVTDIAELLSVSERAVRDWTKEARADEKREQQERAWDLHLDCWTQQMIADEIGADQATVSRYIDDMQNGKSAELHKPPMSRQHFDIWQFQNGAGDTSYFGRMPEQVVENLLWLYTEPGQTVVDPFVGGGTTIDVAKRMGRRIWASDRKPSTPTLPIHEHDITTGWPAAAPKKADLVLLDPPYWKQAAGRYSDDPECLGNMTLDDFAAAWERVVGYCVKHLADGGRLAYIVSPAEDKDANRVVDLALLMYDGCRKAGLAVERRVIVPYQTQQATGQQVEWAREGRRLLKLYRDLVVMR